jgi:hypothetical protein
MTDELHAVKDSVESLGRFMQDFSKALDALAEGVSLSAADEVRHGLAMYSQIVPVFDERLQRCVELIGRGLREEALSRAADGPALLDAVTLLDLASKPQWATWQNALARWQLPTPALPRMDQAATLVEAQNAVNDLKPLLDRWRRLNLSGCPLPERIRMLRKLRGRDANNPVWFESLVEHERQRLMEMETEIKAASTARDERRLESVCEELQEQWLEPVPNRLAAMASTSLESCRGSRIERQLAKVARELRACHEARDLEAGQSLRGRWAELAEEKGVFALDDPNLAVASPAVLWVDRHDRLESLFVEIWQSLDTRPAGWLARRTWVRSLERMGDELEDLAEKLRDEVEGEPIQRSLDRVAREAEALRRDEAFRRRVMYVIAGTAVAGIAAIIIKRDIDRRFEREVTAAVAAVTRLTAQAEAGELESLPVADVIGRPKIRSDARVHEKWVNLQSRYRVHSERRERLGEALATIDESIVTLEDTGALVRGDPLAVWPEEFAKATRLIDDLAGRKDAVTATEQARVVEIRGRVDAVRDRFHRQAEAAIADRVMVFSRDIEDAVRLAEAASDGTSLAESEARLSDIDEQVAALRKQATSEAAPGLSRGYGGTQRASREAVEKVAKDSPLDRMLAAARGQVSKRRRFVEGVKRLDACLGDWPRYVSQLQALRREFADYAETREFEECIAHEPQWRAADHWNAFVGDLKPLSKATSELAGDILKKLAALPADVKSFPAFTEFEAQLGALLGKMASRDPRALSTVIRNHLEGPWMGELPYVITVDSVDGRRLYFARRPVPAGANGFEYVSGMKVGRGNWPLANSGDQVGDCQPSSQSKLQKDLTEILKLAVEPGLGVDRMFMKLIETAVDEERIKPPVDPVVSVVAIRKFLIEAAKASLAFTVPEARALLEDLDDKEGGIRGIEVEDLGLFVSPDRDRNQRYAALQPKLARLLEDTRGMLPAVRKALQADEGRLAEPPPSTLRLVGRLGRDAEGKLIGVFREPLASEQLVWFSGADGVASAGFVDAAGVFTLDQASVGPSGSPLYMEVPASPAVAQTRATDTRGVTARGSAP